MSLRVASLSLMVVMATTSFPAFCAPLAEKRIVVAPGIELRAIETGSKDSARPIVFIPGWSTGADIWRDQIKRFGGTHRIVSFDPRSQGQSTKTMDGNTPEERASDLYALLATEQLQRPVLVAWSQAVQDVAAYVLKYGTKDISGIVLVDAAVSEGAGAIARHPQDVASQFQLFGIYLGSQQDYLRGMFGAIISKPQPPGVVDHAIETGMKTPPSIGMSMLVADMFTTDRRSALSRIDCPVLIIASGSSPELDLQKAEIATLRNARFVQIDDAAHAVFLDQPSRFAAELEVFLKSVR